MSEAYLREEGFTDIQSPAAKQVDLYTDYVHDVATDTDGGIQDRAVAGLHLGCIELFARAGISTITDLRGKTIAVTQKSATVTLSDGRKVTVPTLFYGLWVSLLAHVGMQASDANFVEIGNQNLVNNFVDGKADAIVTVAAQGTTLHANPKNPGHVILDTTMDKPWSQYYCCVLRADSQWAKANPVALKRATRAILRAVDQAGRDRRAAARVAIDKGYYAATPTNTEQVIYDTIQDLSYDWREYDVADSMRFYVQRLTDAKLVKKTPQQILDEGTDLAWFRQLQKELKP